MYGHFTGLMFCGSCFGIAACGSNMKQLELYFFASSNISLSSMTPSRLAALNAESYRCWAAYFVLYSFEFPCVSIAILIILERMLSFSSFTTIRRLALTGRIMLVAIIAGNAAGVIGNIATAVYLGRTADYCDEAAAAFLAAAAGVACTEASATWGTELTPEKPEVTDTVEEERGGGAKEDGL